MPSSTRHNGASLPPRPGGGGGGGDFVPDYIPNYGDRLRRARMGLGIAMAPILVLFISFSAAYLIRRGFVGMDVSHATYIQTWVPVRLPWTLLLANTAILILSSLTIDRSRRLVTREAALEPVQSIPGISLGNERHFPWLPLTTILGLAFLGGQLVLWSNLSSRGFTFTAAPVAPLSICSPPCTASISLAEFFLFSWPTPPPSFTALPKHAASSSTSLPGTGTP